MAKKQTKEQVTLVNFILDKSGSMGSIMDSTISGFNEYIQTLKDKKGKFKFSLTLFDTLVEHPYSAVPLAQVEKLDNKSYSPSGMTALYDAVCKTIKEVEGSVGKNEKVVTVIMTDGQENSSVEYKQTQMRKDIERLEKTGKWSFVYLGANQDSYAVARDFGIAQGNTANFVATSAGATSAFNQVARGTCAFYCSASASTKNFFQEDETTKPDGNKVK